MNIRTQRILLQQVRKESSELITVIPFSNCSATTRWWRFIEPAHHLSSQHFLLSFISHNPRFKLYSTHSLKRCILWLHSYISELFVRNTQNNAPVFFVVDFSIWVLDFCVFKRKYKKTACFYALFFRCIFLPWRLGVRGPLSKWISVAIWATASREIINSGVVVRMRSCRWW